MSVYRHKKTGQWVYDFVANGDRFSGPRKGDNKYGRPLSRKEVADLERERRVEIKKGSPSHDAGEWLLIDAAERWFTECEQDKRSSADTRRRVDVMVACIGAALRLRDVDGAKVSVAIQKRRGMITRRKKPPSNATVNRDIIAPLRATLYRARRVWGARNMPEISWKDLTLAEPKGVVREYTDAQVTDWKKAAGADAGYALHVLLTYGLRFGELFFSLDDLDTIGKRLTVRERKADEDLVLPLLDDDARALSSRAATARAKGYASLWYDDIGEFTYWALRWRLQKAGETAGIKGGRLVHGARHHAATRITRASGNLAVAKQLLGHASIISTARYAHALEGDVRNALEALSRSKPQTGARKKKEGQQ